MTEDSPNPTRRQAPQARIAEIEQYLLELKRLYAETKDDPAAEARRTELVAAGLYLLECNQILAKLGR